MNWEYKYLLNGNFHPDSRVWIYQSNRPFSETEVAEIVMILKEFTSQWKSHGSPIKGESYLIFDQFIILMADITDASLCGSSMDSAARLIKEFEQHFSVSLFDRTSLALIINEKVQLLPMNQLQQLVKDGSITGETIYFNNLAATKEELENKWMIPLKESWLARKIFLKDTISQIDK